MTFMRAEPTHRKAVTHAHIVYSHGPCTYRFRDGALCVWEGQLLDGMCADHRFVVIERERNKQSNRRRAERRRESLID